jgi:hypothetical protein
MVSAADARERLALEQGTQVRSERVTNSHREQGRKEGEADAYCGPQSTLDAECVVAILNSPLLIHVWVSLRSDVFPA